MIVPREIFMQGRPTRIMAEQHELALRFRLFAAFPQYCLNACMIKFRGIIDDLRPWNSADEAHGGLACAGGIRTPNKIRRIAACGEGLTHSNGLSQT